MAEVDVWMAEISLQDLGLLDSDEEEEEDIIWEDFDPHVAYDLYGDDLGDQPVSSGIFSR
jgi:hypothetical protein